MSSWVSGPPPVEELELELVVEQLRSTGLTVDEAEQGSRPRSSPTSVRWRGICDRSPGSSPASQSAPTGKR